MPDLVLLTPEARIDTYNPLYTMACDPPQVIDGNAATAIKIYDDRTELPCEEIFLHNLAADYLKYGMNCLDSSGNMVINDAIFSDVIDKASALNAGDGAQVKLQIKKYGIKHVSVFCQGTAVRVVVQKFRSI